MLYKTYNNYLNSYALFCKVDFCWRKLKKDAENSLALASHKNIIKDKNLAVASFAILFLTYGGLPKKLKLKKATSFYRSRAIHFWGYRSFVAGNKFYTLLLNVNKNLLKKNINYGFIEKTDFFFGKKKSIGNSDAIVLDELSETNYFQYKDKFGFSMYFFNKSKNYINIYPWI